MPILWSFCPIPFFTPRPMKLSFHQVFCPFLGNDFSSVPAGRLTRISLYPGLQLHHEHIAVPPELVNIAGSHPVALYFQSSTFVAKTGSIQEVVWNISYQQIIHRMLRCFVFHIILTPGHTVPDMQLFWDEQVSSALSSPSGLRYIYPPNSSSTWLPLSFIVQENMQALKAASLQEHISAGISCLT